VWRLPEVRAFSTVEHEWIAMPDGVRLSARLWLPETPARVPVVLEYIPYRKRDLYRAIDDHWGPVLASHGIGFARVDVRGTGESEGVIADEYSQPELNDGVACIAWLAAQSWSNGRVGMRGISWGGINTLQIAAMRPPALKAIMPMCCSDNRFTDDAHYIGGAPARANFQWGTLFKLVLAGPPDPAIAGPRWEAMWRERLEATPSVLSHWLSHQRFDAYWRRGAVDIAAIRCATYVVGGWLDTYLDPVCRLLQNLSAPRKALVGPWGHTYPSLAEPLGLDWKFEELRWWHHWLNDVDTGIMEEPLLRAFMPYATPAESLPAPAPGRWIEERAWPSVSIAARTLFLGENRLRPDRPSGKRVAIASTAPVGLCKPEWLNHPPLEQSDDDANSLIFDSATLDDDLEILGQPVARLRIASDKPLGQIAVRLTEAKPDGKSWLVSWTLRNLSHRASHEAPSPLTQDAEYDLELPLHFIAHRFNKGSRVRLAISCGLWPLVWPAPESFALTVSLAHSRLTLPVRPKEAIASQMAIPEIRRAAREGSMPITQIERSREGRCILRESTTATSAIPDLDLVVARAREELAGIDPGKPNHGQWSETASQSWKRSAFDCRIEASFQLRSTPAAFMLSESLIAWLEGKVIFERRHENEIARDLI
jgi:predicted acyl esterase